MKWPFLALDTESAKRVGVLVGVELSWMKVEMWGQCAGGWGVVKWFCTPASLFPADLVNCSTHQCRCICCISTYQSIRTNAYCSYICSYICVMCENKGRVSHTSGFCTAAPPTHSVIYLRLALVQTSSSSSSISTWTSLASHDYIISTLHLSGKTVSICNET